LGQTARYTAGKIFAVHHPPSNCIYIIITIHALRALAELIFWNLTKEIKYEKNSDHSFLGSYAFGRRGSAGQCRANGKLAGTADSRYAAESGTFRPVLASDSNTAR
jgi:hypothetical protein